MRGECICRGIRSTTIHVKNYGHPSKFGFMEIDHLWKAEHWEPEKLMDLYVKAGAKYFVALANHHDNFDNYDSTLSRDWNSVHIGPKKDIVGTWAKLARERGLRFGVTNHSAHAWHWFQTAYGYDPEGPLAGVRYDAYQLHERGRQGPMVGRARSAGALHRPQHGDADGHQDHQGTANGMARQERYAYGTRSPPPTIQSSWSSGSCAART